MPVITLQFERFKKLLNQEISNEKILKFLPWIGVDIEEIATDYVKIEYNPCRMDFSSSSGIARSFKGLMGWEVGLQKYEVKNGEITVNVENNVANVRPYILGAIVHNLEMKEEEVKELMAIQEDLHWGIGRNRKKAAIGIHNLDVIEPPFTYTASDPDKTKFIPLEKDKEMSLREITQKHEKGIIYKDLIEWSEKYPLLLDKNNKIFSMPPIINSELTRVTHKTKNLFIDVTGKDYNSVNNCINLISVALADLGGILETVIINYPDKRAISPDLNPKKMKLNLDYVQKILGLKFNESSSIKSLRKCRFNAVTSSERILEVTIPAYRIDILHEVDLVEEIAVGYGYYNLKSIFPAILTTNNQNPIIKLTNYIRQIMVGLGFTEVMNFILTNEDVHFTKMRQKISKIIKLANPVSNEYSITREEILPSLMCNLSDNKHEAYPQRIFEVSDVIKIKINSESMSERNLHVAGVSTHSNANYTEIHSIIDALLNNLGIQKWVLKEIQNNSFISGRVASVIYKKNKIGIFGEIHPEVLENFGINNPVGAFEIDLTKIN